MLLREVRYGINLGFLNITINPFGPTSFNFHVGDINVDYSADYLTFGPLPGTGSAKSYTVTGMTPGAVYVGAASGAGCVQGRVGPATATPDGVLAFTAPVGPNCTVTMTKQKNSLA